MLLWVCMEKVILRLTKIYSHGVILLYTLSENIIFLFLDMFRSVTLRYIPIVMKRKKNPQPTKSYKVIIACTFKWKWNSFFRTNIYLPLMRHLIIKQFSYSFPLINLYDWYISWDQIWINFRPIIFFLFFWNKINYNGIHDYGRCTSTSDLMNWWEWETRKGPLISQYSRIEMSLNTQF